jgi:hypothetical protein
MGVFNGAKEHPICLLLPAGYFEPLILPPGSRQRSKLGVIYTRRGQRSFDQVTLSKLERCRRHGFEIAACIPGLFLATVASGSQIRKKSGPKFWLPALSGQGLVAKLVAIL